MNRIDSVKTSLISTKPIFFTGVDLTQQYTTQCVVIAGNRGANDRIVWEVEVMRSEVIAIQSRRYWIRHLLLSVLVVLLGLLIVFVPCFCFLVPLYRHRMAMWTRFGWMIARYNFDDVETMHLLGEKPQLDLTAVSKRFEFEDEMWSLFLVF